MFNSINKQLFISCILFAAMAGVVCGVDVTYVQGIDADNFWSTGSNWNTGVAPTSAQNALINTNGDTAVIASTGCAAANVSIGPLSGLSKLTMTGGSLSLSTASALNVGYRSGGRSEMYMQDGAAIATYLYVGNMGEGYLKMTGGTINLSWHVWFGSGSSTGTVDLYGGTITAGGPAYFNNCLIDIHQGVLSVAWTNTAAVLSAVDAGKIIAYGGDKRAYVDVQQKSTYDPVIIKAVTTVPMDQAWGPEPNGLTAAPWGSTLSWNPGDQVEKHTVYFGENLSDAEYDAAPVSVNQDANTYDPGILELGKTYYWRVDEANRPPVAVAQPISVIGSWVSGLSHTAEAGENRALLFFAFTDDNTGDPNLTAVTYGGKSMKKIFSYRTPEAGYYTNITAYILGESGIAGASNATFVPTWNVAMNYFGYASVFVKNVDQANLVGAKAGNGNPANLTPGTISTAALATAQNDLVIVAAASGLNGSYTVNNGFTEAMDQAFSGTAGQFVTGYKAATGASETPSVTCNSTNRQTIIGFVLKAYVPGIVTDWPGKGDIWSFTVRDNFLVEDFSEYANTGQLTGSWVGTGGAGASLSTTEAHWTKNSLIFDYSNAGTYYSEVRRTFGTNQDWTLEGVIAMDLWFKGEAGNSAERMYVTLEDSAGHTASVNYNGDANDIKNTDWQVWHIALGDFAGVNQNSIKKLSIGFGNHTSPGGSGTVYFDDIWLYPVRSSYSGLLYPDLNGDNFVNFIDFARFANNWLDKAIFSEWLTGDLNGDGIADTLDAKEMTDKWLDSKKTAYFETTGTIGLANNKVQMEFDKGTGMMVVLKNLTTGDNYIKGPENDGNPFRTYIDTTVDIPAAGMEASPFIPTGTETTMGGTIIDPKNCLLTTSSFAESSGAGVLTMQLSNSTKNLRFDVVVTLPDNNEIADVNLIITNTGTAARKVMTAFPYLTGLTLGTNRSDDRGVSLRGWGFGDVPAWINVGWRYGIWTMQWNAVYDKAADEALGIIQIDQDLGNRKIYRRFAPSGMSVCHYPAVTLSQNGSTKPIAAQIIVSDGTWRFTAREYAKRITPIIHPRKSPAAWYNNVTRVTGGINFPGAPDINFQSFADMPWNSLVYPYEVLDRGNWMELVNPPSAVFPNYNGDYIFRADLGGVSAFAAGVENLHQDGRWVKLILATHTIHTDAVFYDDPKYPSSDPNDWRVMDTISTPLLTPHTNFYACFGYSGWQQRYADIVTRLMSETKADGIYMDEGGGVFWDCFNPAHHHPNPYGIGEEFWGISFIRNVREALDLIDPNIAITAEGIHELNTPYIDGAYIGWNTGTDIAPLKYVFPHISAACSLGTIPAAMNNWSTCGGGTALIDDGWTIPYHETIQGQGCMTPRPDAFTGLTAAEITALTPTLNWPDLLGSFTDKLQDAQCTVKDPTIVSVARPQDYAARLWMCSDYWLFVGGHIAGWAQSQPLKFKMPELPKGINSAYEIDTTTMVPKPQKTLLAKNGDAVYLTVNSGFSAILLPLPGCRPMVFVDGALPPVNRGESIDVKLYSYSPWTSGPSVTVTVKAPGLQINGGDSDVVTLPATVTLSAPSDAATGYYSLMVSGDNSMPARRIIQIK